MGMTDSEMDAHDRLTGIIATLANLPSTNVVLVGDIMICLLYTSPSPRDVP